MSPQENGLIVVLIVAAGILAARTAKTWTSALAWLMVAGIVAGLAVQAMR